MKEVKTVFIEKHQIGCRQGSNLITFLEFSDYQESDKKDRTKFYMEMVCHNLKAFD